MKKPQPPPIRMGIEYFIYDQVSKQTFEYFGQIQSFFRWTKLSKGTSTGQDLSFKSIIKSLCPSAQKFWPIQEGDDRQTYRRTEGQTDGHPNSIGPQFWNWGLKSLWDGGL